MCGINRRKNVRVHFVTKTSLTFADKTFSDLETKDLCIRGMFVVGAPGVTAGELCTVTVVLSGATTELTVKTKGEVVRVDEDGIAVRFLETDLDSFFHLKNIVYFNTDDPDQVMDEVLTGLDSRPEFEPEA